MGNSLVVQWLGVCVLTAKGPGSVPGGGTKIPQAAQGDTPPPKKKKIELMCSEIDFLRGVQLYGFSGEYPFV